MPSAYFFCNSCRKRYPTHQKLFETLYHFREMNRQDCPECGGTRQLHLRPDFQLGCGDEEFKIISAFLPEKLDSWLGEEEQEVTLYPFLVILERATDAKQFCWTPYWHLTGKEARYGQHAMCLDRVQFENLISQAQEEVSEKTLEFV